MSNIIDLAARLALHESVRPFLTILSMIIGVAGIVLATIIISLVIWTRFLPGTPS